jgi:hypothetical protein
MLDLRPTLCRKPLSEFSRHEIATTATRIRLPRAVVLTEPPTSSSYQRMLAIRNQLTPEHRLNERFRASERVLLIHVAAPSFPQRRSNARTTSGSAQIRSRSGRCGESTAGHGHARRQELTSTRRHELPRVLLGRPSLGFGEPITAVPAFFRCGPNRFIAVWTLLDRLPAQPDIRSPPLQTNRSPHRKSRAPAGTT